MIRRILLFLLAAYACWAAANIDAYTFSSPQQEARFRHLTEELRCPRCQNESLAGSDAPIARDLKDRTYLMLQEGKSDAQIRQFLIARYGDFVSYRPPLRPGTLILWWGPWVLLVSVGLLLWSHIRRRNRQAAQPLDAAEQARLRQLLSSTSNRN